MKPSIGVLNVKATNGCNLRCKGCSHQSQWVSPKSGIDIDALIEDLRKFDQKVNIQHHISLLGGEVLLEPRWSELLTAIEDIFLDKCQVRFYTNGLLLDKHKEQILEHIKRGSKLRVSIHEAPHTKRGKLVMENIEKFVEYAHSQGVTQVKGYDAVLQDARDGEDQWDIPDMVSYSRNFSELWSDTFVVDKENSKVYPYNSDDINLSYSACPCANVQLYQGRLWKCAQSAYLRDTLSIFGQSDDPEWERYLKYVGVSLDDDVEMIRDFCDTQYQPSWICSMCPKGGNYFVRDQDESFDKVKLIPVKVV